MPMGRLECSFKSLLRADDHVTRVLNNNNNLAFFGYGTSSVLLMCPDVANTPYFCCKCTWTI